MRYVPSEQKTCFRDFEHLRQERRSCLLNYCKIMVYFTPCRSIETKPLTSSSKCAMSIVLKLFSQMDRSCCWNKKRKQFPFSIFHSSIKLIMTNSLMFQDFINLNFIKTTWTVSKRCFKIFRCVKNVAI